MRYEVNNALDHRMYERTASRVKSINLTGRVKRGGIRF